MIPAEWSRCRAWLLAGVEDATEAEILAEIDASRAQLWPGDGAAFVTQLVTDPPRLHVWVAGGSLAGLLAMIPGMAAWGRAQGCEYATVHGRKGWARVLARHGFEDRDGELWKAL